MINFKDKTKYKLIGETSFLVDNNYIDYFISAYLEINTEIVWLIRSQKGYVGVPINYPPSLTYKKYCSLFLKSSVWKQI